jgi:hypothetical protein
MVLIFISVFLLLRGGSLGLATEADDGLVYFDFAFFNFSYPEKH